MVGSGPNGEKSILAQVSVVNESGNVVYSSFVAPTKAVTDYRTHVSGITPDNIDDAPSFSFVQSEVRELIRGKIIVGHALENDFDVVKNYVTRQIGPRHSALETVSSCGTFFKASAASCA